MTTTPTKAMTAPQETPLERVVLREARDVLTRFLDKDLMIGWHNRAELMGLLRALTAALEAAPAPVLCAYRAMRALRTERTP